jgi:pimeloyl-ACP methyl ester carboxylesterase
VSSRSDDVRPGGAGHAGGYGPISHTARRTWTASPRSTGRPELRTRPRVSPDGDGLDNYYLARPGADEIQLDLFADYASNVALYPAFHEYFRTSQPPLLAIWGRNGPFFLPTGAEAFKRDLPDADVRFVDTGHFALETHVQEIATAIRELLPR